MDKVISSPLRYWGGKRWLFKTVFDLIPEGETEIFSPFLGGGSIEINLAYRGYTVHAYDNYQPLINFWQAWLSDPEAVRLTVYKLLELYSYDEIKQLRFVNNDEAMYLITNRLSWNGIPNSFMKEYGLRADGEIIVRPNTKHENRKMFPHWDFWKSKPLSTLNVQQADFEQIFWIHNHQFAYVDPPYFGNEKGYGGSRKNGFKHDKLRELLGKCSKWVLSYNDHPKAYEMYGDYPIRKIKRGSDGKTELLITSPDITEKQLYLF